MMVSTCQEGDDEGESGCLSGFVEAVQEFLR